MVTDNVANYKKMCTLLAEELYYNIIWSGWLAYCVDLILKDVAKMPQCKFYIDDIQSVRKYIYNHNMVFF